MPETNWQHKIDAVIDGKTADIERIDDTIFIEMAGVSMALDQLRKSLDKLKMHLNDREFEKASQLGYQEVAQEFVFVQRTLAGLQTAVHKKDAFISTIAQEINGSYEDAAPYVEGRMQSAIKKSAVSIEIDETKT
ncbi:MAG: hypothetical protein PHE96_06885 [Methylococcales bacterium]|nr:hypothetical protein [Methylococcales bacterium]